MLLELKIRLAESRFSHGTAVLIRVGGRETANKESLGYDKVPSLFRVGRVCSRLFRTIKKDGVREDKLE